MKVTLPVNLTLLDWAAQVVLDLDTCGAFGRLDNPNDWQNWAAQFTNNLSVDRNLPNPYGFADWREWAERFVGVLG